MEEDDAEYSDAPDLIIDDRSDDIDAILSSASAAAAESMLIENLPVDEAPDFGSVFESLIRHPLRSLRRLTVEWRWGSGDGSAQCGLGDVSRWLIAVPRLEVLDASGTPTRSADRVRSSVLREVRFFSDQAAPLLAMLTADLPALTKLTLESLEDPFSHEAVCAFFARQDLPSLRDVFVSPVDVDPSFFATLAESRLLPQLRSLCILHDCHDMDIANECGDALARVSARFRHLDHFEVSGELHTDAVLDAWPAWG